MNFYSGGVDRTGLVIAMETALLKMEIVEPVNPLDIVRSMRDKRGMMLPAVVSNTKYHIGNSLLYKATVAFISSIIIIVKPFYCGHH